MSGSGLCGCVRDVVGSNGEQVLDTVVIAADGLNVGGFSVEVE